jgi:hypothetical protein
MNRRTVPAALVLAVLAVPGSASAFSLADTCGHTEPGCPVLHWETDGDPIPFRLHHDGAADVSFWSFETQVRRAFATWADVPTADIDFEEGGLFMGAAAYQETDDIDRHSVLFFIEEGWTPDRSPEVIALTSITYGEAGVIIEADIGFNAEDWTFTVGDGAVQVDFLSIAVHEIGHFLGLDHSAFETAVMSARYDEGETRQRTLTDDDIEGIGVLYPCDDSPCRGEVGPGCHAARRIPLGGAAALAVIVALLGILGDRRRRAGSAAVLGLALLVWPVGSTVGSVVEALDVDVLAARADVVVRATVQRVEPYLDRRVRSVITLSTVESWKGLAPDTIRLDQPGGRLPDIGTLVFGMPRFEVGEDVVVFLSWPEGGSPRVLGLAQGKVDVLDDGSIDRDVSGLALAHMGSQAPATAASLPGGVDELRARVAVSLLRRPGALPRAPAAGPSGRSR